MTVQTTFIKKNKNPNTGREDTYTFNPTMASTELPNYSAKEGAYGSYATSVPQQKAYANEITDQNNWNQNLQNVAKEIEAKQKGKDIQTGSQSKATQNAYTGTNQTLSNLSNTLSSAPQQRNIQEGYTVADLNKMAENGFNTLNEGYQNALDKAAANYNRLGLRGSGFELADEFGNQSDSITSNYLKNVQQLQNDIATKGLEAAREDRYKNAEANEANQQKYIENLTNLAHTQQSFADSQNKNDLNWLENSQGVTKENNQQDLDYGKYQTSTDMDNKTLQLNIMKMLQDMYNQSDSSQLKWGELNGSLGAKDDANIMERWDKGYSVEKDALDRQYEIFKAVLQNLGLATTGDPSNYNAFVNTMNSYPDWLVTIMKQAGMPVPSNGQ